MAGSGVTDDSEDDSEKMGEFGKSSWNGGGESKNEDIGMKGGVRTTLLKAGILDTKYPLFVILPYYLSRS